MNNPNSLKKSPTRFYIISCQTLFHQQYFKTIRLIANQRLYHTFSANIVFRLFPLYRFPKRNILTKQLVGQISDTKLLYVIPYLQGTVLLFEKAKNALPSGLIRTAIYHTTINSICHALYSPIADGTGTPTCISTLPLYIISPFFPSASCRQ